MTTDTVDTNCKKEKEKEKDQLPDPEHGKPGDGEKPRKERDKEEQPRKEREDKEPRQEREEEPNEEMPRKERDTDQPHPARDRDQYCQNRDDVEVYKPPILRPRPIPIFGKLAVSGCHGQETLSLCLWLCALIVPQALSAAYIFQSNKLMAVFCIVLATVPVFAASFVFSFLALRKPTKQEDE